MPTLTIDLPEKLAKRLADEAKYLHVSEEVRIIKLIDKYVTPREYIRAPRNEEGLKRFQTVLESIPSVRVLSTGAPQDALWWIKLDIDTKSPIAWHVIQLLGFVLNYISLQERLPTAFMPVSPPPYLNGGPHGFLSWVIESTLPFVNPGDIAETLASYLPDPVDDIELWKQYDEPEWREDDTDEATQTGN